MVTSREKVSPGEYSWFVGDVPLKYELRRDQYTITLKVSDSNNGLGVTISVIPYKKRTISFAYTAEKARPPCVRLSNPNEIYPGWGYGLYNCDFNKIDRVIRFNVFDESGTLLRVENIPYEVKHDGAFMYYDAI